MMSLGSELCSKSDYCESPASLLVAPGNLSYVVLKHLVQNAALASGMTGSIELKGLRGFPAQENSFVRVLASDLFAN